jgi:hypothetical protein
MKAALARATSKPLAPELWAQRALPDLGVAQLVGPVKALQ